MPPVSTARCWTDRVRTQMDTPDPADGSGDTRRTGRAMYLLAALALLGVLWLFFEQTLQRRDNPNRDLSIVPGAGSEITLQRNRMGHYVAPGAINGQPVVFLLDTGATVVSVPARLGAALGLQPGASSRTDTANGTITVRETSIDELGIGPFRLRGVRAHLNPGMDDDQVLLGMSVLGQLDFTQRGDTLILHAPRP